MAKQTVRCEDALGFLADALRAPAKSKQRQSLLESALMAYYFGLLNQHKFKVRGDRRGRPDGSRGERIDDAAALSLMERIAADTGKEKPRSLAKLAIDSGQVAYDCTEESAIRRLTQRYICKNK
jgi:hypothetical protein